MSDSKGPKSAADFPRTILTLFDEYVHGGISRRAFLDRSAAYLGSAAAAGSVLAALAPDFARGQVVSPEDARIATTRVDIASPAGSGSIRAYVARPAAAGAKRWPVVLVAHENRGLNPHIEDIARRLAVDGFIAVAPDALTALGGYPGNEDDARALFARLDQQKIAADFAAAALWAEALDGGNGRPGAVGFCWGGGMVNTLATKLPTLRAGVAFYGAPPELALVPRIRAELLLHFAGNDQRIDAMWPGYQAALKQAHVRHAAYTYPNVEHGFNNDTTPRFDRRAAALAWRRTLALFRRTLA